MADYDARRWLQVLTRMQGSVLPSVLPRVTIAALLGAFATYVHRANRFHIAPTAHAMLGAALALLLVARTHAAYLRWREGQRFLDAWQHRATDLMRQCASLIEGDDAPARDSRARIQRLLAATSGLVVQDLRGERDLAALGKLLTDDERARLESVRARPAVVAQWLSAELAAGVRVGRLTEPRLVSMDANVAALLDAWVGAERLAQTPLPFAYAHHTKALLALYCFTAPFALVDSMRLLTPLVSAAVTYALFGIDEVGVQLEAPFGNGPNALPTERTSKAIAATTLEMLRDRDEARPVTP